MSVAAKTYNLMGLIGVPVVDRPDLTPNEFYHTGSRHGFVRLKLNRDFGQNAHQNDLIRYLREEKGAEDPKDPPVGPFINELFLSYSATQIIALDSSDLDEFDQRIAHFYHLAPFGHGEQHPALSDNNETVYLLPRFSPQPETPDITNEGELYIGISDLKPPQNLSLLFQVADGTADPLTQKPDPHMRWSYLCRNEWVPFKEIEVEDHTDGLLNSGIVTFSVPRHESNTNTLLSASMHWIRAAVETKSDAVCRLISVSAQALEATLIDKDNDPAFAAKVLEPGTIAKLLQPSAKVKKIIQPYPTFAGRGAELPRAFYTRVSERLRHKDRAIAPWDYERLILEAFPGIYKVKCLNHTRFEKTEGGGIYNELAPGHVTIVTIPSLQHQNLRDPCDPTQVWGC